jgi:4-oxalocrotonate tautomerase
MSMAASTPAIGKSLQANHLRKDGIMPYVNIKVTREGTAPGQSSTTPAQKAALIKGVSELLLTVLDKPLAATFVVIDEVDLENWGVGGLPVDEYRQQVINETTTPQKK